MKIIIVLLKMITSFIIKLNTESQMYVLFYILSVL